MATHQTSIAQFNIACLTCMIVHCNINVPCNYVYVQASIKEGDRDWKRQKQALFSLKFGLLINIWGF